MKFYRLHTITTFLLAFLFAVTATAQSQNRDQLPAEFREYTNPEEVVTFDRTTSFSRALDVINDFAQEHRNKVILDRSNTEGEIGISVPPMHWMDALRLIMRVKELTMIEQEDFFEIVTIASQQESEGQQQQVAAGAGAAQEGEGPIATTKTHEVRINAVFFEGNRQALREVGVDWSSISENVPDEVIDQQGGGQGGGGQGGQQGGQVPSSQFDGPFVQVNAKGASSVSQDVFNALINVGEIGNTGIDVQALFSAFEADNLGEILASPTVKVMDGEEGRIQVGQDFSIKQRDIAGNVVEEFFSVGTILEVTPRVIEQNDTTFVHLDIAAERSTAQPDAVSTIINTQEAETQALLLDGEATVIAGLYSTETSEVRRGIPILKDLPGWFFGLRYLFGYSSSDSEMRELVILLQADLEPRIPERLSRDELKGKYEVLEDERQRMRDEIEESKQAQETRGIEDIEDLKEEEPESDEEVKNEAEEQEQDTTSEGMEDEQEVNQKEENEEDAPVMTDPEVKTEEIKIDLGGEDEQEAAEKEEISDTTDTSNEEQTENNSLEEESEPEQNGEVEKEGNLNAEYYIIGGSFKETGNAEGFRNKLAQDGFDSLIIHREDNGWMFVAYGGFNDRERAVSALEEIKQDNPGAWLYSAN